MARQGSQVAVDRCPECGAVLHEDAARGEWVCPSCGLALDAPPSDRSEVVAPSATPGQQPPGPRRTRHRLDAPSSSEARLIEARQEVRRLASVLGCPSDVAERGGMLIERARKAGLTQGRRLDALAGASLLIACRMLHLARTEEEVAAAAKAPWSEIQAAYKALVGGLHLPVPAMTAHEYLGQLASALEVPPQVEANARRILQTVCGTRAAAGKNPLGWAGAALILAAQEHGLKLSVNRVAKTAGVSGSTVAARVDDLGGHRC